MISLAPGTKVFLACQPIDLRAGFNGLAAKAQQVIGQNPFDGSLFIFRGKRGDYSKAIYWDGSGLWPHRSPHFVPDRNPPNNPELISISANRCISGSSRCSGMFGISS